MIYAKNMLFTLPQKVKHYLGVFLWKEKLDKYFRKNKSKLDHSSVGFKGSHTSAIRVV